MNLPAEPAASVAIDLFCVRCGYNLRTQPVGGLCPECATPVRLSLRAAGGRLADAPAEWVRGLANGTALVLTAFAVSIIGGMCMPCAFGMAMSFSVTPGTAAAPGVFSWYSWVMVAQVAVAVLSLILAVFGLLRLTRPQPGATGDGESRFSARRVTRFGTWLVPVPAVGMVGGVAVIEAVSSVLPTAVAETVYALAVVVYIVGAVLGVVAYPVTSLACLRYLRRLLLRIPRTGLAQFAAVEFWGLLVTYVLVVAGWVLSVILLFSMVPATFPGPPTTTAPANVTVTSHGLVQAVTIDPNAAATQPAGPYGTATTAPATVAPAFAAMQMMLPMGCAACVFLAFVIAGFVLLAMTYNALRDAAREAEQMAARTRSAVPSA